MATTTNYSWSTPDDTALVKDGAAAIRSLGTAIDTTVFNNAGAAIAKTIVDAKGDIIAATAADTVSRLAVGANDTVLTADSSTATGLKWAAPAAGGGATLLSTTTLSGATTTISGISGSYKTIYGIVYGVNLASNGNLRISPNGSTDITETVQIAGTTIFQNANDYAWLAGTALLNSNATNSFYFQISEYASTATRKPFQSYGSFVNTSSARASNLQMGAINTTSAITSLAFTNSGGNFSAGTILLYGVN